MEFIEAIQVGDVAKVRSLLDSVADDKEGALAAGLFQAVNLKKREIADLLVRHGADPQSGLYPAAANGWLDMIEVLLSKGASANPDSGLPIIWAAKQGQADVIHLLVQQGADVNVKGGRAIVLATLGGHEEAVKVLIKYGANVNPPSNSPLYVAKLHKHESIATLLEQHGANDVVPTGSNKDQNQALKKALEMEG